MSANVETMMYVREIPWHGLGTRVEEAPNSTDALKLAGLDWDVIPKQISIYGENSPIANAVANVRSSDNKVLGIVTDRYTIVQNRDAFQFTDNLIGEDVRYETAGSLKGGKLIWLLAKMPKAKILDDDVEPYLCFTNTHDGSGAVRVCMTPIRVVCNNTLNLALNSAKRSWSVKHTGDIGKKIHQAEECLELADRYMRKLNEQAEKLANITVSEDAVKQMLETLYAVKNDASEREIKNAEMQKANFLMAYNMADIAKFYGTAWGVINAATDMVGHAEPMRQSTNYAENRWAKIMNGNTIVDTVASMIA